MSGLEQYEIGKKRRRPYSAADFDGYHAAPLLVVGPNRDEKLAANQDRIAWLFGVVAYFELLHQYERGGREIADFVAKSINERMGEREALNATEYMTRLYHEEPRYDLVPGATIEEVEEACYRAQYRPGTMRQVEMARTAFGMPGIEYANVTFIGNFRRELEPKVWEEASEFTGVDARPRFEQITRLKLLGFDSETDSPFIRAIRMGMKRDLATLENGTEVKVRTAAVICPLPGTPFTQKDALAIREAVLDDEDIVNDLSVVPEAVRVAEWVVNERPPINTVPGRNETIYGHNPAIAEQIRQIEGYHYHG